MEEKWKSIFPEQDKLNKTKIAEKLSIGAPYILLLLKMLFSSDSIHIDDKTKNKDKDKDKDKDKGNSKGDRPATTTTTGSEGEESKQEYWHLHENLVDDD